MKDILTGKPAYLILRLILGGIFVYAGALKLMDPPAFAMTINLYGLVSWKLSKALSYAIPIIEVITGLGLILDVRGALATIVAQLLGFMCILFYAVHAGIGGDCGCFGSAETTETDSSAHLLALLRDGIMLITAAAIYCQRNFGGLAPRPLRALFSRQR